MNKLRYFSFGILILLIGVTVNAADDSLNESPDLQGGAKIIMGGDILRISVDESPDLDDVYPVAGDGSIDFKFVGRISVEGKSLNELSGYLKERLELSYFKHATVRVEVSEYVSGSVLILGAVKNPGVIPYQGDQIMTLLEAIISVGGMTDRAADDKVKIFRWKTGGSMEREVISVDIKRMMEDYDFTRDEYLRPRDIVVVPELGESEDAASEFLALGEFGDSGFHSVVNGMNTIRAISVAGGVTREAHLEAGRILRPDGSGNYSVIPVDLARLLGSADMSMNFEIYPGDIFFLPSASQASGGKVYFLGEINNPGVYPLPVNGKASLARTILARGGLEKFSDGSAIKVLRRTPDGSQQRLIFDVEDILKKGDFDKDIPLQDEDVIIIDQKFFSF